MPDTKRRNVASVVVDCSWYLVVPCSGSPPEFLSLADWSCWSCGATSSADMLELRPAHFFPLCIRDIRKKVSVAFHSSVLDIVWLELMLWASVHQLHLSVFNLSGSLVNAVSVSYRSAHSDYTQHGLLG